jgi:hypothetical protein
MKSKVQGFVNRVVGEFRRLGHEDRTIAIEELRDFVSGYTQGRAEVYVELAEMKRLLPENALN